ncbi:MAG TPA: NlpC/P60 family protein [Gaiellaceae bacterium]|nr:NlpC/P60 family protein [Gaiellaceae bacterium]
MPAILILLVAALVAVVPANADQIGAKKAEVQRVLGEINQLNINLGKAVEAYDSATVKLQHIRNELSVNKYEMKVAKANYKTSIRHLEQRLVQLYQSSDNNNSTIEVLLGSKNLGDMINGLETQTRVTSQDARILNQVVKFRHQVAVTGAALERAHQAQQRVVAARAAAKQQIQSGIAEHQRLVNSIRGEIQRLQAEEAARQALLAAQARARLVQQQQEAQARLNTAVVGVTTSVPSSTNDPNAVATVAPPSHYGGVVGVAMAQLGKPYVYGTAGPNTFDCSGLVVYSYAAMGVSLPHSSYELWNVGVYVSRDQLEPGDILFFDGLGHVGIYIGGGQFIQAPHTGDVVKISSLDDPWYAASYVGARRVL